MPLPLSPQTLAGSFDPKSNSRCCARSSCAVVKRSDLVGKDDMWVFTRYGFYSIACASKPDGSLDGQSVMIRARCIDHLHSLQKRFPMLSAGEIHESQNRDYRYRLIVPKVSWISILSELAQEQEWSNFKDEAARYQGTPGMRYGRALHEVWAVMNGLQQDADSRNKSRM